jgi:hypothetical protein
MKRLTAYVIALRGQFATPPADLLDRAEQQRLPRDQNSEGNETAEIAARGAAKP